MHVLCVRVCKLYTWVWGTQPELEFAPQVRSVGRAAVLLSTMSYEYVPSMSAGVGVTLDVPLHVQYGHGSLVMPSDKP